MNEINEINYPYECEEHGVKACKECVEKSIREEKEVFFNTCGSCGNFVSFVAESGLCKNNNNYLCRNPKALKSIWDDNCENWEINEQYEEEYEEYRNSIA